MTLRDSVVSGNEAGEAGGIRVDDKGLVVNSTISGNRVVSYRDVDAQGGLSGEGGGIDVRGTHLDVINSTITRNFASDGGGGLNISLAYIDVAPPALTAGAPAGPGVIALQNSIVAGNSADATGKDCRSTDATFTSLGNNIDSDGSCGLSAKGDRPKAAPRLGRLRDNGGPTMTHALPERKSRHRRRRSFRLPEDRPAWRVQAAGRRLRHRRFRGGAAHAEARAPPASAQVACASSPPSSSRSPWPFRAPPPRPIPPTPRPTRRARR